MYADEWAAQEDKTGSLESPGSLVVAFSRDEERRRVNHALIDEAERVWRTLRNGGESGGDPENVESLTVSLERMETIIGDALMLTRGRDVEDTEPVTLTETARDAWSHVDTGDSTLDVTGNVEGAVVAAGRSLLMQLLENLFRNAVEHAGETVTVTVETVGDGDGRGFAVADDGPGIPEEEREHVFDVGHTTDGGGTGMGLAIVELIAEAHGWDVTVGESDTGGARFAVTGVETIPTPDSTAESD
jgi:signal transduction histidine kinase